MIEIWKPVVGWEGQYEVSSCGGVKSLPRLTTGKNKSLRRVFGQSMKTGRGSWGYPTVRLSYRGHTVLFFVHKLVLEAFAGPRPEGFVCNHKDGNKSNNHADNLEWVTESQNCQHAYDIGLHKKLLGSLSGSAKLSEADIPAIRLRLLAGERVRDIADFYEVSSDTIGNIKRGTRWGHVEGSIPRKYRRKLTAEQVVEIRKLLAAGVFLKVIGKRFGVSVACIHHIKQGVSWK